MEEIMRQIEIYRNLYIVSLLTAITFLIVAVILFRRWEIYRLYRVLCRKSRKRETRYRMKQKEEVIDEKTNLTVKLNAYVCDVTELISESTQGNEFWN